MPFQLFRLRRPELRHCGSGMGLERLLILTALALDANHPTEGTIALQGLIGLEKAITNDLHFVSQLGGSRTTSLDGGDRPSTDGTGRVEEQKVSQWPYYS